MSWLLAVLLVCGATELAGQNGVPPGPADSAAARRPEAPAAPPTAVLPADTGGRSAAAPADAGFAAGQPHIRPIAVAKWTALAGAVAAAVYGYRENRLADSRFDELDLVCQREPDRCQARTSSGAYQDAELEAKYQEVKRLDHRAAVGLVAAEVSIATSVALFLLDLRHTARNPPNIPYNPPRIELLPGRRGGVELLFRAARGRDR